MELYKYQGAGNDFLIADNRAGGFHPNTATISSLCARHYGVGADGLMLLENDPNYDFKMVFHNPDGTGGMMCGNGGRCIVAFAADLGIRPKNGKTYEFLADDGPHSAEILDYGEPCNPNSTFGGEKNAPNCEAQTPTAKTVRLKMKDVTEVRTIDEKSFFLDTGTRHFVRFVSDLKNYDVFHEGREIRNLPQFSPIGTNVNFVEEIDGILHIRTYEKGVEDETCACGTGITASAIAAAHRSNTNLNANTAVGQAVIRGQNDKSTYDDHIHIVVRSLHDELAVDFIETTAGATDVHLTGPAMFVCKIILSSIH